MSGYHKPDSPSQSTDFITKFPFSHASCSVPSVQPFSFGIPHQMLHSLRSYRLFAQGSGQHQKAPAAGRSRSYLWVSKHWLIDQYWPPFPLTSAPPPPVYLIFHEVFFNNLFPLVFHSKTPWLCFLFTTRGAVWLHYASTALISCHDMLTLLRHKAIELPDSDCG